MRDVQADLEVCKSPRDDDWVASCGVCYGNFVLLARTYPDNPSASGTFCPDCRARKLIAPGVLHWKKRGSEYVAPSDISKLCEYIVMALDDTEMSLTKDSNNRRNVGMTPAYALAKRVCELMERSRKNE